ncbi:MAG TPA: beta-ribofuranosylaminobenzene 5'-phosphate synthase family protein [Burkholderiales bacterium]
MKIGLHKVSITAPARLHFGFLDLNGSRGRRFGSIGLALDEPTVSVTAERASSFSVSGMQAARARKFADLMRRRFGLPADLHLNVERAIPEHAGLGSGTQLGLAVGVALTSLYRLDLGIREVAAIVERGQRSGIGVGAFESGGCLVDGGRGEDEGPPPVVSRVEFPGEWRIVLVFDRIARGLHGKDESAAFRRLPAFPEVEAGRLCRLVLMQALPALMEQDLNMFGKAIGELQRVTGDYFAPAQGGRFSSPRVGRMLAWMEGRGISGVGQSSWGPTGFAICGSAEEAAALALAATRDSGLAGDLELLICAGRNRGGLVEAKSSGEPVKVNSR